MISHNFNQLCDGCHIRIIDFCHMRKLVIGDIHAGLQALIQVLDRAGVTDEDQLIFLGDYVDGWSEAVETVNYLINLKSTHNCILLKGNHDQLCGDWLVSEKEHPLWLRSGGEATIKSYEGIDKGIRIRHLEFFNGLLDYYLDDEGRLFLHAGFTNQRGVGYEYFPKAYYWDRTLWELALALDPALKPDEVLYPKRLRHYKEIYIGHTPVSRIGKSEPHLAANVWNMDTGAGFSGPLSVMDVESKEIWQSDPVNTLYPNESGRN